MQQASLPSGKKKDTGWHTVCRFGTQLVLQSKRKMFSLTLFLSMNVPLLISTIHLCCTDTKASFHTLQPLSGPHQDFKAQLINEMIKAILRLLCLVCAPWSPCSSKQLDLQEVLLRPHEILCEVNAQGIHGLFLCVMGCYIPQRHLGVHVHLLWEMGVGMVKVEWLMQLPLLSWHLTYRCRGSQPGTSTMCCVTAAVSVPLSPSSGLRTGNYESAPI